MKILVVEDCAEDFKKLHDMLLDLFPQIEVCGAERKSDKEETYIAIFCDIRYKGNLFLDTLGTLGNAPVIFIKESTDYQNENELCLAKPIQENDLCKTLAKALMSAINISKGKETLKQSEDTKIEVASSKGVSYAEATLFCWITYEERHVLGILPDNTKIILHYASLKDIIQALPSSVFFPVNRKYIVNLHFISTLCRDNNNNKVVMMNDPKSTLIKISRIKVHDFIKWLKHNYEWTPMSHDKPF